MIKTLASASTLLFILCAPALAQPAPPPVVAAPTMKVELTVKVGAETRVHQVVLSGESCGTVRAKSRDFEDEIRVCSVGTSSGTRIEASWKVRDKLTEYHLTYAAAVARGGTVDAFAHGATFTLALK